MNPCFFLIVLKLIGAKAVVMQSMIHMLKHVFKKNNTNVKVFNLMSRTNETRHIK